MTAVLLLVAPTGAGAPPMQPPSPVTQGECPLTLYITIGPEGAFKVGTCEHCVIHERGRPARAWNADGDRDLDFDREQLLVELAEMGIQILDRHAYVCP